MVKTILTLEETFARLGVTQGDVKFDGKLSLPILHESIRGFGPYIPRATNAPGILGKREKLSEDVKDWHDDRPDDHYDAEQLRMGIEVEKEHTNDEGLAKKIARDHLDELPNYYSRLSKMEKEPNKPM
jgi:hypothetical protein